MAGPQVQPAPPEVKGAGTALALSGIATISAELVQSQLTTLAMFMAPSQHQKGSLNRGGGGGGKGSGCGKQAPCGKTKKESSGCGGGGGGCGKSKKKSCCPSKLKVMFKDITGKAISVHLSDGTTTTIQKVEKQSTAEAPWTQQSDLDDPSSLYKQYNLRSQNKVFDRWSTYDWTSVNKDIEAKAIYRNLITDKEESTDNDLMDKASEEDVDKIQNFSDEYLNYKVGSRSKKRDIEGYNPSPEVKNYGKYNAAVDMCILNVDTVTSIINHVFETLVNHTDECIDWNTFNDLKKCLLNIQSSFVYQTRMSINLDLQDVYTKLMFYVDTLLEKARNGEEIDNDINEYRNELDLDLDFFAMDTRDRYKEFVNSFNSYVDTINKCFTTAYINKVIIQ